MTTQNNIKNIKMKYTLGYYDGATAGLGMINDNYVYLVRNYETEKDGYDSYDFTLSGFPQNIASPYVCIDKTDFKNMFYDLKHLLLSKKLENPTWIEIDNALRDLTKNCNEFQNLVNLTINGLQLPLRAGEVENWTPICVTYSPGVAHFCYRKENEYKIYSNNIAINFTINNSVYGKLLSKYVNESFNNECRTANVDDILLSEIESKILKEYDRIGYIEYDVYDLPKNIGEILMTRCKISDLRFGTRWNHDPSIEQIKDNFISQEDYDEQMKNCSDAEFKYEDLTLLGRARSDEIIDFENNR